MYVRARTPASAAAFAAGISIYQPPVIERCDDRWHYRSGRWNDDE